MAKMMLYNIKTLYTAKGNQALKGKAMSIIEKLDDAFILIDQGKIIKIGERHQMPYLEPMTSYIDCKNAIALPGFIDSHTHLVHSGSRESEFAMKLAGMPYLDILKSGGGIHSTVALTRQASFEELYDQAKKSLDEMLLLGVTTIEAKSGYGLNLETELKQLKVIKALNANHPIELSPTYLGAHAIPKEYSDNRQSYIFEVIENMKTVAQMHLAESVDVFCENEVFSVAETEEILIAAKEMGFQVRLHADEIHSLGGAGLAVRLNAVSADHLLAIVEEDIDRLAQSETIANLLPQTAFYLNKPYANARALIDKGAAVAISSDYNPGSAPSENFQFTMQLAANKMRLSPAEVLVASTLNPAVILGRSHRIGTLEVGKQADITLLKAPNLEYVLYHFGINHTQDVYKNGRLVVKDRQFVKEEL